MPAKILVIAFSLTLGLTICSIAADERISDDDDFGSYPAAFEEPAAEGKEPVLQRYPNPGLVDTVVAGPWQTPQQAPTMMECASGVCRQSCEQCCRGGWEVAGSVELVCEMGTGLPSPRRRVSRRGPLTCER